MLDFHLFVSDFLPTDVLFSSHNRKGNPKYPWFTSVRPNVFHPLAPTDAEQHYKPASLIFKPEHRKPTFCSCPVRQLRAVPADDEIVLSNFGVGTMLVLLIVYMYQNGFGAAAKYYWIPWLVTTFLPFKSSH
jgi:hypothetical protein